MNWSTPSPLLWAKLPLMGFKIMGRKVWTLIVCTIQSRLISVGLEPVLSYNGKLCIASYYRQFFTNIKIKINTSFVCQVLWSFVSNKTVVNLIVFHFNIYGKLSIIQWDKQLTIIKFLDKFNENYQYFHFVSG